MFLLESFISFIGRIGSAFSYVVGGFGVSVLEDEEFLFPFPAMLCMTMPGGAVSGVIVFVVPSLPTSETKENHYIFTFQPLLCFAFPNM